MHWCAHVQLKFKAYAEQYAAFRRTISPSALRNRVCHHVQLKLTAHADQDAAFRRTILPSALRIRVCHLVKHSRHYFFEVCALRDRHQAEWPVGQ